MSMLENPRQKVTQRADGSRRVVVVQPKGEGRTRQDHKEECDVNFILRNYPGRVAQAHYLKYAGQYGDFPAGDFHEAVELVRGAQGMFMDLPAKVRARFGNDPGAFLAFVQDPRNESEMRELGLFRAPNAAPEARAEGQPSPKGAAAPGAAEAASGSPAAEGAGEVPS